MVWAGERSGWLLSFGHTRSTPITFVSHLFATTDGGRTWKAEWTPCAGFGVELNPAIAAADGRHLWLGCGGEASAGAQLFLLARSTDGGLTWGVLEDGLGFCCFGGLVTDGTGSVLIASDLDETAGIASVTASGRKGSVLGLNDVHSWGPITSVGRRFVWVGASADTSHSRRAVVYRTADGGLHWSHVGLKPDGCGCIHHVLAP